VAGTGGTPPIGQHNVANYMIIATRSATPPPTEFSVAEIQARSGIEMGGVVNRVMVEGHLSGTTPGSVFVRDFVSSPIPGTPPVVSVEPSEGIALLANGDVYNYNNGDHTWEL